MRLPETYTELRKQTLEQEGMKYPGKALVAMELEPGYERAKNRMLPYIQAKMCIRDRTYTGLRSLYHPMISRAVLSFKENWTYPLPLGRMSIPDGDLNS